MKNSTLIAGSVIGVCIGSAVVFGVLRSQEGVTQPQERQGIQTRLAGSNSSGPSEHQLTSTQVEDIHSTVNAYLELVKEKKWDQAQKMNSIHQSRSKEFRADWESFGTISGFKHSEPSAMHYPVNPDPVVVKVLYSISCTKAPAGSVPIEFRVVERAGKWIITSQHRLGSRP